MLRCLAIADLFIDKDMMGEGLESLNEHGIHVTIKTWAHPDLEALQEDNIKLEKQGSEAVLLPDYLMDGIEEYDMLITQFAPIGKQVIDKAKKLKIIGVLRAGIENVNSVYANEKGITVLHTPGRSETSVSEFTVGLILSEIRNIARANAKLKGEHKWEKYYPNGMLAPELKESVVGLVGYGAIGQKVANLIRPFGGKVIFFDDYFNGETEDTQVSLDELVEQADIISMHYRLTPATTNMLNREHFLKMKNSAVVVNSARAGLINEQDLIEALQKKEIAGAAIDVFDQEPLPNNHPYLSLENVTITPHIAGSTIGNFANSPKILAHRMINEYLS